MLLHGKVTFDGLAKRAMADAMKQARKITDPEGDTEPTAYLYRPNGQTLHIHSVGNHFVSPAGRDEFLAKARFLIRAGEVTLFAYTMTGYGAYYSREELEPEPGEALGPHDIPRRTIQPRKHPQRTEALWLHVFDAEIIKSWTAEITRRPDRAPRYGPWKLAPGRVTGRVIDPILEAMR